MTWGDTTPEGASGSDESSDYLFVAANFHLLRGGFVKTVDGLK